MRIILTVMLIVLFWYVPILNLDILCSPNSLVHISKDCTSCVHRKLMQKQLWHVFSIEIKSIFSSELHQFYHCLVLARIFLAIGIDTICFVLIDIHPWLNESKRKRVYKSPFLSLLILVRASQERARNHRMQLLEILLSMPW